MSLLQDLEVANQLKVNGPSQIMRADTTTITASSITLTSNHYGKHVYFTYAGAVAVTLPANGAPIGTRIRCINANSNTTDPTYSAASANTLIAFNDATASSVNFATGHRIASVVEFESNGTYWMVTNISTSNTMDIT